MSVTRPYVLAECNWRTIREAQYDVAILPWGATEAHNLHLPYATDIIESSAVAEESARIAWASGARVIVLPTVPFGVNTGQLDIPFCLNMNPSTQAALLRDLVRALEGQGITRLVILNGHGGNDFRAMIRELQPDTGVFLCTLNWWTCVDPMSCFDEPGDHAGELETSVMLHIAAPLVAPLESAGDGAEAKASIAALREGWVWAPRPWTKISRDTGTGNPHRATAEKGEKFFTAVTAKIASFLVELAATDTATMYGLNDG